MGIIIGILIAVVLILGLAVKLLWGALMTAIDNNPKLAAEVYFDKENIDTKFPCTLLLTLIEGADQDARAFDFSRYEECGIIALTQFDPEVKITRHCEDRIMSTIIPDQMVYKMKDGSYHWDICSHL